MALDKAGLLGQKTLRRKLVALGEGAVWMREFAVAERARLKDKYKAADDSAEAGLRSSLAILAVALETDDGAPMFTDAEIPGAVEALGEGSSDRVGRLIEAMQELNGLGEGALKEALGKSEPTPSGPSSSE